MLVSRSPSLDPATNLALEEYLLDHRGPGESRLHFYVNSPCVVIGRNQNPWVEASPSERVFRRASGGGAVVHGPGCLCWSFMDEAAELSLEAALDLVVAAVLQLGIRLRRDERGALWTVGGKICGSARLFRRSSILVHGTLLVHADPRGIRAALEGLPAASSKAIESRRSVVAGLADQVPSLGHDDLVAALVEEARSWWGGAETVGLPAEADYATYKERYLSEAWTWRRTPDFSMAFPAPGRVLGEDPGSELRVLVEKGLVASIEGDLDRKRPLASRIGARFDPGDFS